jgi:putative nucleotidyltransferase with HDIG domain
MPKEPNKTGTMTRAAALAKRGLVRGERRRVEQGLDYLFRNPATGWGILIWGAFIIVCTALAVWARQKPLVAVGRVMNDTALSRVKFTIQDDAATEQRKSQAKLNTPRVFAPVLSVPETVRASIELLPKTLASTDRFDQINQALREQFRLTEDSFNAIRAEAPGGELSASWKDKTARLVGLLGRTPLLDAQTYQHAQQDGVSTYVMLEMPESRSIAVSKNELVSIGDPQQLADEMRRLASRAGFTEPALTAVVNRLITNPQPNYTFDERASLDAQKASADAIHTEPTVYTVGQELYKRGDELTQQQLEKVREEMAEYARNAEPFQFWVRILSIFGAVTAIALAIAGYLHLFCPRARNHPGRTAGIAALMAAAVGLACLGTVADPALVTLTAVAPVVFVAVVLVIGYDQRVALAMATLQGVLVCIALDQPVGVYALMLTGVSFAVLQLKEIRDRRALLRMGLYAAAALSIGTILVALIDRPISAPSIVQTFKDAGLAGLGGLGVGVLTLALLPMIENAFDITTGLTLIELRDPKQPLLRQLQQKAPGTYNHSLNVASIAEAAADAIRADALLTYVGALYHDIGKMNKPDYFVENQAGGANKHDKLSPAMSLLVIVGHVKDGLAMAQEHGLPKSLQHFIEAHHGTTLVEFFYNRARKQAEQTARTGRPGEEPDLPEEIEYRYPGPKPRTKEAAILMLADAVESATRTMAEPTPSRIDALVRAIANKRLMDGQFDECELTLKDVQTICDSISKSVASIYHGRVLYPSTAGITESAVAAVKEERRA